MLDPAFFESPPLLADGGLRHDLAGRPESGGRPPEALNLEQPELVRAAHGAFRAAGAQLLRTNTAHANPLALAPHGLAERAEAVNNSGVALARAGQGFRGLVMGSLAPPPGLKPGRLALPSWERAYGEQIVYLSDTGVDFFLLEHFTSLEDALALTRRIAGLSDAPVLAALSPNSGGHTEEGVPLADAAFALAGAGAGALGLSCGTGTARLAEFAEALGAPGLPVALLPGLLAPGVPGAPLAPEAFGALLAPFADRGVAILGGCCGVAPAHIRALALALGRPLSPGG